MQKELIELQPQLIQTSQETEELIAIIEKESVEVQEVKAVVEVDEATAAKAAAEAKAIKVSFITPPPSPKVGVGGVEGQWMTCTFTSIATIFQSCQGDGRVIKICSVQCNGTPFMNERYLPPGINLGDH